MRILFRPTYMQSESERQQFFALSSRGRVLDIGCAQYPNIYLKNNRNVTHTTGMDIQPQMTDAYDEFVTVPVEQETFPFKKASFDTILAGEVIEHVRNPITFVLECNRVLRKGGRLIISTPNSLFFLEYIRKCAGIRSKEDEEHLMLFDSFSLSQILQRSGFKVTSKSGYKFWIPVLKLFITSTHLPLAASHQMIFVCRKAKEVRSFAIISNNAEMRRIEIG